MDIKNNNDNNNIKISSGVVHTYTLVYLVLHFVSMAIWLYAVYLSFKCNKGFSFSSFMVAFCCSPCYIAYRYAVKC